MLKHYSKKSEAKYNKLKAQNPDFKISVVLGILNGL